MSGRKKGSPLSRRQSPSLCNKVRDRAGDKNRGNGTETLKAKGKRDKIQDCNQENQPVSRFATGMAGAPHGPSLATRRISLSSLIELVALTCFSDALCDLHLRSGIAALTQRCLPKIPLDSCCLKGNCSSP